MQFFKLGQAEFIGRLTGLSYPQEQAADHG